MPIFIAYCGWTARGARPTSPRSQTTTSCGPPRLWSGRRATGWTSRPTRSSATVAGGTGGNSLYCAEICEIRKCAVRREVDTCAACTDHLHRLAAFIEAGGTPPLARRG